MRVSSYLKSWVQDVVHLVYPNLCIACWENTIDQSNKFCIICILEIPYTDHFEENNNSLLRHFYGRLPIQHAAALVYYSEGSVVQKMMHKFKYESKVEIGRVLGKIAADKIRSSDFFNDIDLLVPIPLFYKKQLYRGYNQSEVFANSISEETNHKVSVGNLRKIAPTDSQTSKTRTDRQINLKNSFAILNPTLFANKHILLVDDVITTGATIEVCANLLLEAGISKLSVLSIAEAT